MISVETLLLLVLPLCSAILGLYLGSWYLRRAVRELQFGLADVEDRLIREVKRRAGKARWEGEEDVGDLQEKFKEQLGALSPAEFVKRKWGGWHGPKDRKVPGEER